MRKTFTIFLLLAFLTPLLFAQDYTSRFDAAKMRANIARMNDVARRHGVELAEVPPRRLDQVAEEGDFMVTVCDNAHEELVGLGNAHWSVPDPLRLSTENAFEDAFMDISHRVSDLAPRLLAA